MATDYKKLLGQYFSGRKLGELLLSMLPRGSRIKTVIDPMAGIGDLLYVAKKIACRGAEIVGVEIDHTVGAVCKKVLNGAKIHLSDAFKTVTICRKNGYDLVVTNPPYVRYQLLRRRYDENEIRTNLISQIRRQLHLTETEKSFLINIAENYSGVADLAVPSWILCAALVACDGWLAIVVPDTWLSRNYAAPIQYMLLKMFDIEFVVHDKDAVWFKDAQVRTTLVVARRRPLRRLSQARIANIFSIDLFSEASDGHSLVGNVHIAQLSGRRAFEHVISVQKNVARNEIRAENVCAAEMFPSIFNFKDKPSWWSKDDGVADASAVFVPREVEKILKDFKSIELVPFCSMGVNCGQGLRTGANQFFYLRRINSNSSLCTVETSGWKTDAFALPKDLCLPALLKRNDVAGCIVQKQDLHSVLFYAQNLVRASDRAKMSVDDRRKVKVLTDCASAYIAAAEKTLRKNGKPIYKLSAVCPNIRFVKGKPIGFWYQIPKLVDRHCPQLCIPRINGGATECLYLVPESLDRIVVDANFSTIWCNQHDACAYFILFNSTWFKCYAECCGTVLGGGALKLEATTIKKFAFLKYSKRQWDSLVRLAYQVIHEGHLSPELQCRIDSLVLKPFGDKADLIQVRLAKLLQAKLNERARKNV